MNEIVLILIFYIIPGLFVGLAVYFDEEIQTIGDFVEYLWAVLIPFVNIFILGVLLVNFIVDFIQKKIKLDNFWEKIKNTKIKNKISETILPTYTLDINIESPKQETLEEAAERLLRQHHDFDVEGMSEYQNGRFNGIIEGAKWQQEQDKNKYSDEEVLNLLQDFANEDSINVINITEWFEKHKKK